MAHFDSISIVKSFLMIIFALSLSSTLVSCGTNNSGAQATLQSTSSAIGNSQLALQVTNPSLSTPPNSRMVLNAIGGQPPYQFTLISAPTGVTIDPVYGILKTTAEVGSAVITITDAVGSTLPLTLSITHQMQAMGSAVSPSSFSALFAPNNAVIPTATLPFASSTYSSNSNSNGIFLAGLPANQGTPATNPAVLVSAIFLKASMVNGQLSGFPATYTLSVTNPQNSAWVSIGTFSQQPDGNGNVVVETPVMYSTYGVMVTPVTLGGCVPRTGGPCTSPGLFDFEIAQIGMGR